MTDRLRLAFRFRVKAFNEIGESDPLVGETILAINPYTVPGKPRNMEAIDISADSLTLQWNPPESVCSFKIQLIHMWFKDGGAPLTEFIVERRDKAEKDWNVVGHVPAGPH